MLMAAVSRWSLVLKKNQLAVSVVADTAAAIAAVEATSSAEVVVISVVVLVVEAMKVEDSESVKATDTRTSCAQRV
jgi:hypothetical protein